MVIRALNNVKSDYLTLQGNFSLIPIEPLLSSIKHPSNNQIIRRSMANEVYCEKTSCGLLVCVCV